MSSSNAFLNCRIEWRASRLHALALATLGALAGLSLALSALPWLLAVPGMLALSGGSVLAARRELRRPDAILAIRTEGRAIGLWLDEVPVRLLALNLRGPLVVLVLADASGRRRLSFWPDTLTSETRRTFRLLKQAGRDFSSVLPLVAG